MKHNDAKALVEAMFGTSSSSGRERQGMNSPNVQKAYSVAFGGYPPLIEIVEKEFWAERLREISDALANRCSECDGKGGFKGCMNPCQKCKGEGWVGTTAVSDSFIEQESDIVKRIKSILKQFGIVDSDDYVQATIYLDYEKGVVGVSVKKNMFGYASNKTANRRITRSES